MNFVLQVIFFVIQSPAPTPHNQAVYILSKHSEFLAGDSFYLFGVLVFEILVKNCVFISFFQSQFLSNSKTHKIITPYDSIIQ